jgi:hypothetical protein
MAGFDYGFLLLRLYAVLWWRLAPHLDGWILRGRSLSRSPGCFIVRGKLKLRFPLVENNQCMIKTNLSNEYIFSSLFSLVTYVVYILPSTLRR